MKQYVKHPLVAAGVLALSIPPLSGSEKSSTSGESKMKVFDVNPDHFIPEGLIGEITKEERELSDGRKVLCYVIKTKSAPHEHEMGPWSPKTITDTAEKGGIWFANGEVHDVDGPFVANIAEFYDDPEWKLYREDGTVKITESKEAFLAAARPNVDENYHNHVVEGKAEWFADMNATFVIPVTPIFSDDPGHLPHGSIGIAFNGVGYDPPAPTEAILAAHTLAPLDDAGGHLNPFEGYHYHAATGKTKEVAQNDGHAAQIGYALDGFPIFAHLDTEGNPAENLDECGGHYDEIRGYHYHVGAPGENQIIKSFRGVPGTMTAETPWTQDGEGDRHGGAGHPPHGRPPHGAPRNGHPPHEGHSHDSSFPEDHSPHHYDSSPAETENH